MPNCLMGIMLKAQQRQGCHADSGFNVLLYRLLPIKRGWLLWLQCKLAGTVSLQIADCSQAEAAAAIANE